MNWVLPCLLMTSGAFAAWTKQYKVRYVKSYLTWVEVGLLDPSDNSKRVARYYFNCSEGCSESGGKGILAMALSARSTGDGIFLNTPSVSANGGAIPSNSQDPRFHEMVVGDEPD